METKGERGLEGLEVLIGLGDLLVYTGEVQEAEVVVMVVLEEAVLEVVVLEEAVPGEVVQEEVILEEAIPMVQVVTEVQDIRLVHSDQEVATPVTPEEVTQEEVTMVALEGLTNLRVFRNLGN